MPTTDKENRIKQRQIPRRLTVKSARNITPNMRRVTLFGDALEGFPDNAEGAYIKLLFDQPDSDKPIKRTYTVARQRATENEIDVDFMLHVSQDNPEHYAENKSAGDIAHGIAAPWSMSAKPGDKISISGPGSAKFINTDADYFLLAADMTALPALTANLKLLPENAQGKAFIEICSEADKQDLTVPENIELVWVVNDDPGSDESPLYHAIKQANWQDDGKLAAWSACEFKTMKKIRHHLKTELEIEPSHLYISSYWKRGEKEEAHKLVKRADLEACDS